MKVAQIAQKLMQLYEELQEDMNNYFHKYGKWAVQVVVVFNGHGSSKGLSLASHSDNNKNETVCLDNFIDDLQNLVDKHRSDVLKFPHDIQIIFAQCHAHHFTDLEREDINIVKFTSETKKRTQCSLSVDKLTKDVTDSVHFDMENYASSLTQNKDEQQRLEERKKKIAEHELNFREGVYGATSADPVGTIMDTSDLV